jgi:hypothetical protein
LEIGEKYEMQKKYQTLSSTITAAQQPQWLTQPSAWNGKSQLKSAIMIGGKTYQVNDTIDKWVLKYQNFPDPDKKQAIIDAGELTDGYFEEFRPIIVDDLNFTLYDWTQPGEDAFQDLVLKVLLNRKPLPQAFSYTLKNPAKHKDVQVVDFMKRGKLSLSEIEIESAKKEKPSTKTVQVPYELEQYIMGKGGAVDPKDAEKYRESIYPKLKKMYPSGLVTLYRGIGTIEGTSKEDIENYDQFSQDVLLSFTEDEGTAISFAKDRAEEEGVGAVLEIEIPIEKIYFHWKLDPLGLEHPKEKEVTCLAGGESFSVIKMFKGSHVESKMVQAAKPFHVTEEKIFLDTVKYTMDARLKTLKLMVRNYNRTGDTAQVFSPLLKQIEKQAQAHYNPKFSLREVIIYLMQETGVKIEAAPKMAYPTGDFQFQKSFKNWSWTFQKDLVSMAKKHPWFDISTLAKMVNEYQDNCTKLFPPQTVTSKLDVKFHTVMIEAEDCQPDLSEEFAAIQKQIPQEAVYEKHPYQTDFPDGREMKPHTTVFYGIKNGDDMDPIREHCSQLDPISFKIGNISVFRNDNKPYDVLKVEVISPQMKELHYWIKDNFDNVCEFDFNGHMTLAYIQKDTCQDIEGPCDWTGAEYTCDVLDFSHAQDGHFKLPLKPEKITGEVSPTDKKEYGGVWTLKNSTNLLKFQKMQKTISELMVSTSSGFSLNTLKEFFISNLKIASQEIHQYFLQHKLPDTEKKRLLQILESGQTQYLKITSEVKIDKTGQHSFRVVFKETEGFVDSPLNFRLEFEAYCYPEFSSYLTLTFLRIGPRKEFYKTESATNDVSGIWYHGRAANDPTFSLEFVGQGHDQEGPGFYFSRDAEDASKYGGAGGSFLEVEVNPRKLASNTKQATPEEIQELIERAPDYEIKLTDWDENPKMAMKKAIEGALKYNKNQKDQFQQIWYDFYRDTPAKYCEALIAMGYDGHIADRRGRGWDHLIMYNPKKIKIVEAIETSVHT